MSYASGPSYESHALLVNPSKDRRSDIFKGAGLGIAIRKKKKHTWEVDVTLYIQIRAPEYGEEIFSPFDEF